MNKKKTKNQNYNNLTKAEAAEMLGISTASVTNWVKHGLLTPPGRGKFLCRLEVNDLKNKIGSGEVTRLNQRANKSGSDKSFLPDELLEENKIKMELFTLITYLENLTQDLGIILFILSLKQLMIKELLPSYGIKELLSREFFFNGKKHLAEELYSWFTELDEIDTEAANRLLNHPLPDFPNITGIIYQTLMTEGNKAKGGSYYTPKNLIRESIKDCITSNSLVMDPCCGTGQFLLTCAEYLTSPEQLYGMDIDALAVRIARINLFIHYPDKDFKPNIICCNTLTDPPVLPEFDFIATNPPWGCHFSTPEKLLLQKLYPEIRSGESFSYFLLQGIKWLKEGGKLVYFLPESVCNVKYHQDIRNRILAGCRIESVSCYKKLFKNVFSPVVIIKLKKDSNLSGKKYRKTIINRKNGSYAIDSRRFLNNPYNRFDISINDYDKEIIDKIHSIPHTTLKNRARWALGIVTGDNGKYVHKNNPENLYEPVYKGTDVEKFKLKSPGHFISFEPDKFQQVAKKELYRYREKLIYRFISSRLVFAYDTKGSLTLNSANILIPEVEDYPVKLIIGLFNSSLYQFIFKKSFGSIKVLKSHLEALPLPLVDKEVRNGITGLVTRTLDGEVMTDGLNEKVFDIFNLSVEEREYILNNC